MPYSAPATVTGGTTITSAWGNSVKAAADYLANAPSCRAYHTATQSIANATLTALAFNAERHDNGALHDTATNNSRITITDAGVYVITGQASFAANSTGRRSLLIRLNGVVAYLAETDVLAVASPDNTVVNVSTIVKLAAADYVELLAVQTSGGALNVLASDTGVNRFNCEFAATWVSLG